MISVDVCSDSNVAVTTHRQHSLDLSKDASSDVNVDVDIDHALYDALARPKHRNTGVFLITAGFGWPDKGEQQRERERGVFDGIVMIEITLQRLSEIHRFHAFKIVYIAVMAGGKFHFTLLVCGNGNEFIKYGWENCMDTTAASGNDDSSMSSIIGGK